MWAIILFFSLVYSVSTQETNKEYQLIDELLKNRTINTQTLPVQNTGNDTVIVTCYFRINHVVGFDEARGVLKINGWMAMRWVDASLSWNNNKKFSDVYFINMPSEKIWKPNLHLLNSAEFSKQAIYNKNRAIVRKNGIVYWAPAITLSSVCDLDFTWFPMDEQTCSFYFTSWTYDVYQMDLSIGYLEFANNITTDFYDEHNEWEILNTTAKRTYYMEPSWPLLEFKIQFRRRAEYYHLTFVIPSVVALMLTLAIFWFPPSSTEKLLVVSVTNVYLITFLVHLYWVIPRSGIGIPGIVVLCGNMAFFSGLALILSIVTQVLSQMNSNSTVHPFLINLMYGWLGSVLCLPVKKSQVSLEAHLTSSGNMNLEVNEIKAESSKQKIVSNDWIMLATMVDRLCFLIYCLSYFIILLVAFT